MNPQFEAYRSVFFDDHGNRVSRFLKDWKRLLHCKTQELVDEEGCGAVVAAIRFDKPLIDESLIVNTDCSYNDPVTVPFTLQYDHG